MSAFWLRMSRFASSGVATTCVSVKFSDAARQSVACCVASFALPITTMVRTFFTSVVMAKPNSSIMTIGMPNRISMVRLSRTMCFVSLITNEINCFIVY